MCRVASEDCTPRNSTHTQFPDTCWRLRQQHSHENRSCSQRCRHQQDQQIQPTIRNLHLHSSGHWNSCYLAPPGIWAGPRTGKAGDHNHIRLQRDHLPVPGVISGFAKGERGFVSEHVHSRLACCNQLLTFLTSIISAYGFVLAAKKNNNRREPIWRGGALMLRPSTPRPHKP